jgi:hypothetical protein
MHDTEAAAALAAIEAWRTNERLERDARDASAQAHTAKQDAIIAYGEALLKGRLKHLGDQVFGAWIADNNLDQVPFNDRRGRSAAIQIAELIRADASGPVSTKFAGCQYNTPQDMMKWARENGLWPLLPPVAKTIAKPFEGNLDAVVVEFGRNLGFNLDSPSWEARKSEIKGLFTYGTEHLRAMVFRGRGSVGLGAAYQFARDKTPEEQDAATVDGVKGYRNNVGRTRESPGGEEVPGKLKRNERRTQLAEWQRQQNEAAINAALRRAGKPKVTDAEFERPPPELIDQQYPGREPGVTYAKVHREQHGPIWHNVGKRRKQNLALKLKELAAELEKAIEDWGILDPDQQASIRKRWRIAAERIRPSIDLADMLRAGDDVEQPEEAREAATTG